MVNGSVMYCLDPGHKLHNINCWWNCGFGKPSTDQPPSVSKTSCKSKVLEEGDEVIHPHASQPASSNCYMEINVKPTCYDHDPNITGERSASPNGQICAIMLPLQHASQVPRATNTQGHSKSFRFKAPQSSPKDVLNHSRLGSFKDNVEVDGS